MKTDTRDTHTHIKPNELNALRDTHAHFCFVSDEVEGHTGQKNRENGVRKSRGNAQTHTCKHPRNSGPHPNHTFHTDTQFYATVFVR